MKKSGKLWRLLAAFLAFTVIAAACGSDGGETAAETTESSDASSDGDAGDSGGLAACPNPIVIQTDWFPEPEHGAVYLSLIHI